MVVTVEALMAIIYELRGRASSVGEFGINLYFGCAVGCRYCYDVSVHRMTWEKMDRQRTAAKEYSVFTRAKRNAWKAIARNPG